MGNDSPCKAAAIDLGSNSFRMLAAEKTGTTLRPFLCRLETVGLGEGLAIGGNLSPAGMQRAFDTLRGFRQDLDRLAPQRLMACGTEALRQAGNSAEFLAAAEGILGCRIEILTGVEEARLTFEAVSSCLDLQPPFLIADVGGGSTELILVRNRQQPPDFCSLPFGALSLADKYEGVETCDREAVFSMRQQVKDSLCRQAAFFDVIPGSNLIGSGGTITALAALLNGLTVYDRSKIHGSCLTLEQLGQTFNRLCTMTVADRCRLFGLEGGRGRIIVAGLAIFQILAELCRADKVLVSDAGLLEGILLSALAADGTLAG